MVRAFATGDAAGVVAKDHTGRKGGFAILEKETKVEGATLTSTAWFDNEPR